MFPTSSYKHCLGFRVEGLGLRDRHFDLGFQLDSQWCFSGAFRQPKALGTQEVGASDLGNSGYSTGLG